MRVVPCLESEENIFPTGGTWRAPVRSLWVNSYHHVHASVGTLWAGRKTPQKNLHSHSLLNACLWAENKANISIFFQSLKAFLMCIFWLREILLLSFFFFERMIIHTHNHSLSLSLSHTHTHTHLQWVVEEKEYFQLTTSRRVNTFSASWEI